MHTSMTSGGLEAEALPAPTATSAAQPSDTYSAVPVAKHVRVRDEIRRLAQGLAPGSAIPSERELVSLFNVSRATVRLAVSALVDDGLLEKAPARGTFVAEQRVESRLHLASFTDDMRRRGHVPSTIVLGVEQVAASTCGGTFFTTERLWKVERLRLADDRPMALETTFLDASHTPDIHLLDLTSSLYSLLTDRYHLPLQSARQTVTAVLADTDQAHKLQCRNGSPLLFFDRCASSGDTPLERTLSWYRADRYALTIDLDAAMRSD